MLRTVLPKIQEQFQSRNTSFIEIAVVSTYFYSEVRYACNLDGIEMITRDDFPQWKDLAPNLVGYHCMFTMERFQAKLGWLSLLVCS